MDVNFHFLVSAVFLVLQCPDGFKSVVYNQEFIREVMFENFQRCWWTLTPRVKGECFAPSQAGLKPLEQPEPQVIIRKSRAVVRSTLLPGENGAKHSPSG